jgi:hypothetical protein
MILMAPYLATRESGDGSTTNDSREGKPLAASIQTARDVVKEAGKDTITLDAQHNDSSC